MAGLSELQKRILRTALSASRSRIARATFQFPQRSSRLHQQEILTRSLDRLVDRGLMIGYGHRTQQKWFIESIRLTPAGRRAARRLLGTQTTFPFIR